MSPVVALDLGNRGNVSGAESRSTAGEHNKKDGKDQERGAPAYPEGGHGHGTQED